MKEVYVHFFSSRRVVEILLKIDMDFIFKIQEDNCPFIQSVKGICSLARANSK